MDFITADPLRMGHTDRYPESGSSGCGRGRLLSSWKYLYCVLSGAGYCEINDAC